MHIYVIPIIPLLSYLRLSSTDTKPGAVDHPIRVFLLAPECTKVKKFPGSQFEEQKFPQFSSFFSPNFPHFYRNFLIFTSITSFFPHFFFTFLIFLGLFLIFSLFSSFFPFFSSFFPRIIFSSQFSSFSSKIFPHFQFFSPDPDPRIQHFLQLCP